MTEDSLAQRVRSVAQAFTATELVRLTLKSADFELELRRSVASAVPAPAAGANAVIPPEDAGPAQSKPDIVSSDLVGVVHFSRPQVSAGHLLESERELAFVEALGIRNPVRSRGTGRVTAVFVTDGQPVDYGQPLFAIER